MHGHTRDLTGKRFVRWLVVKEAIQRSNSGKVRWHCICDCGNTGTIIGNSLSNGDSKSCGCYGMEVKSLPLGVAAFHAVINGIRQNVKKSGRLWELTNEQAKELMDANCFYCEAEPSNVCGNAPMQRMNGTYTYNGIDRIDNSRGYVVGNVVPCCWTCNEMKGTRSVEDFLAQCARIHNPSLNRASR